MIKSKTARQEKTGKVKTGHTILVTIFLVLAFLVSARPALAQQVEVTAPVDRNVMGPEDTFVFSISISSSSDDIASAQPSLPQLRDFDLLNEWSTQEARAGMVATPQGVQYRTTRSAKFNYMLQPKREGSLVIGGAEVVVAGKVFRTKPISVRVAKGASAPRPQARQAPGGAMPPPGFMDDEEDDLFQQLLRRGQGQGQGSRNLPINPNEAFFIQVEADKQEAFVGEQITVSWYLYTRGQIRDLDTLKYPSLRGFWKEDIEIATTLNFTQEVVNGLPYRKALLASFALFPLKEGTATIDSYTAKCSVIPPMDSFTNPMNLGKAYTFTRSSQPVKIKVKPLPAEGRPADFSGAVGEYQVSARVEDKNIVEGQPFTLKVRFEGRGNAKLIELPPFQVPEQMELYDKQNEARFYKSGLSFKDFNLLLIPRREGDFNLPPLSMSIFDPSQGRYISKTTEPVRIVVGKNQGGGNQTPGLSMGAGSQGESAASKEKAEPRIQTEIRSGLRLSSATRAVGLGGFFTLCFLILAWRARVELGWGEKKRDLQRQLRVRLRRVDTKLSSGDWRAVGAEMTNTVYFVLGEISGEGGANQELDKLLMKAPPSIRRELGPALQKQLEVLQVLSFAPESVVGDMKTPGKLKEIVSEMTKLMERAVALGVSSGQADGSSGDPKAF